MEVGLREWVKMYDLIDLYDALRTEAHSYNFKYPPAPPLGFFYALK